MYPVSFGFETAADSAMSESAAGLDAKWGGDQLPLER